MAEIKKLTKKEYFTKIREIVIDNPELVAFVDHEMELLNRKNSKTSQTKTQAENEVIAQMLIQELSKVGKPVTITELMTCSDAVKNYITKENKPLSNQKISAIFKQLTESNQIVKVTDKKKSYFSVNE